MRGKAWSASMSRRQELPRQTGRRTMLESVCMIFPTVSEDWTAYGAMQFVILSVSSPQEDSGSVWRRRVSTYPLNLRRPRIR